MSASALIGYAFGFLVAGLAFASMRSGVTSKSPGRFAVGLGVAAVVPVSAALADGLDTSGAIMAGLGSAAVLHLIVAAVTARRHQQRAGQSG
jgi:hypothetical protein